MVLSISSNKLVTAAVGVRSNDGVIYTTTAENITGLLAPGSNGVNHGQYKTLIKVIPC